MFPVALFLAAAGFAVASPSTCADGANVHDDLAVSIVDDLKGSKVNMGEYAGNLTIIVNVATF